MTQFCVISMKYRKFGNLGREVSALGFGAMRLPVVGDDKTKIDENEAIKMIRYAIDNGVNYVDTAYGYHGGESEKLVGLALKDGYREKVTLATKMPTYLVKTREDFDRFFYEQLEKTQADYFDFYLLHTLNREKWDNVHSLGVLEWAEEKKREGKIKYFGYSFHDEVSVFKEIVDAYDWDFCQIQLNYMDWDYQAGLEGLKYAADKGMGVVIMEPIKGGKLSITPPPEVQEIWAKSTAKRTPAEWALQWVWNQPGVSVVLSGMSIMRHVEENVESADRSGVGSLSEADMAIIGEVRDAYTRLGFIGCTGCRYCMPCPSGVDIPGILGVYNEYSMSSQSEEVKEKYWEQITPESQATNCTACGACEQQCPQELPIRNLMKEVVRIFKKPE